MMTHIDMGSKYFALKYLNILSSLLSDGPEGNTSQQVFAQDKRKNCHRK
jgi:hypothetical protein